VPEASAIKVLGSQGQAPRAPSADSLAPTSRSGVQLQGLQLKSYFQQIRNYSSHEIALYALEMGAVDVAVADTVSREVAVEEQGPRDPGNQVVPSLGIALNATLDQPYGEDPGRAALSPAPPSAPLLRSWRASASSRSRLRRRRTYHYVFDAGLFHSDVRKVIKISCRGGAGPDGQGVPLYDWRIDKEYKEKTSRRAPADLCREEQEGVGYDAPRTSSSSPKRSRTGLAPDLAPATRRVLKSSQGFGGGPQNRGTRTFTGSAAAFPEWKRKTCRWSERPLAG